MQAFGLLKASARLSFMNPFLAPSFQACAGAVAEIAKTVARAIAVARLAVLVVANLVAGLVDRH